jgi:hypothetical protein
MPNVRLGRRGARGVSNHDYSVVVQIFGATQVEARFDRAHRQIDSEVPEPANKWKFATQLID